MYDVMPISLHEAPRAYPRQDAPRPHGGLAVWQQGVLAAYIEKHLADPIRVGALARLVYMGSDYFRRAFKQSFGMPPHRYLIHRRVERAKALLAIPAWSTADIGFLLGFSKAGSFSAAFRHVTGTTPTQYRRALMMGDALPRRPNTQRSNLPALRARLARSVHHALAYRSLLQFRR